MISTTSQHQSEVQSGKRFAFGKNWTRFLAHVSEKRIKAAEESLKFMLGRDSLAGTKFLDIGCGSGLFSLAARRLGAEVMSFDFDPQSSACAAELRRRYAPDDPQWKIEIGSVLDEQYMAQLGTFDIVYSWGVLHHTGQMWRAIEGAMSAVRPGGMFFIALYNDQKLISKYWSVVKRLYNSSPFTRPLLILFHAPYLLGLRWVVRVATGRVWSERGMTLWYDMLDWLGGWPFEVCSADRLVDFTAKHGFGLIKLRTVGRRMGCNEFVLKHLSQ